MTNNLSFVLRLPDPEHHDFAETLQKAAVAVQDNQLDAVSIAPITSKQLESRKAHLAELGQFKLPGGRELPILQTIRINGDGVETAKDTAKIIFELTGAKGAIILDDDTESGHADSSRLATFIRERYPDAQLLGDFVPDDRDLTKNSQKLDAGFQVLSARIPLADSQAVLDKHLIDYHAANLHARAPFSGAVPYIASSLELRRWYDENKVEISKDQRAQNEILRWERAEKDKRGFQKFVDTWNLANFQAWLARAEATGIQIIPNGKQLDALITLNKAIAPTSAPFGDQYSHDGRQSQAAFIQTLNRAGYRTNADRILFSKALLPKANENAPDVTYEDECKAALKALSTVLVKTDKIKPSEWHLRFQRPTFLHMAREWASVMEIHEGKDEYLVEAKSRRPAARALVLNIKSLVKSKPEIIETAIESKLTAFAKGERCTDRRIAITTHTPEGTLPRETQTPTYEIGMQGYLIMAECIELASIAKKGAPFKKPMGMVNSGAGIVKRSAQHFRNLLVNSGIEFPIIKESGSYMANGVPQLIKQLKEIALTDSALAKILPRTTFLFEDFEKRALDTAQLVMGDCDAESGIQYKYLKLDAKEDPSVSYKKHGYLGRVVGGRGINLLDALGSSYVTMLDGVFYQVVGKTYLNQDHFEKILAETETWTDHSKKPPQDFTYNEYKINIKRIVEILNAKREVGENAKEKVDKFLDYLQTELGMPRNRALFLWEKMYESLRQDHDLIKTPIDQYQWVKDGDRSLHYILERVLENNPGCLLPDTAEAIEAVRSLLSVMEEGGELVTMQLTCNAVDASANFGGYRGQGVCYAQPVIYELLEAVGAELGWSSERIPGNAMGKTNTNSAIIFKKVSVTTPTEQLQALA